MSVDVPNKETKAQRMERLKLEKNPWEAFDEVRAFAREGRSGVVPEWASATSNGGAFIRRATVCWSDGRAGARALPPSGFHDAHWSGIVTCQPTAPSARLHGSRLGIWQTSRCARTFERSGSRFESLPAGGCAGCAERDRAFARGALSDVVRNVTGCRWRALLRTN